MLVDKYSWMNDPKVSATLSGIFYGSVGLMAERYRRKGKNKVEEKFEEKEDVKELLEALEEEEGGSELREEFLEDVAEKGWNRASLEYGLNPVKFKDFWMEIGKGEKYQEIMD